MTRYARGLFAVLKAASRLFGKSVTRHARVPLHNYRCLFST